MFLLPSGIAALYIEMWPEENESTSWSVSCLQKLNKKFESYPKDIAVLLNTIRDLIYKIAKENEITEIEEALKWGQPSYSSKVGSSVRLGWTQKRPDFYAVYFNCNTRLVETFKEVYVKTFTYEGNRAIVFQKDQTLPLKELSHCLAMALCYKKLKHLDLLGA
mgnify:CR=1 FL=1